MVSHISAAEMAVSVESWNAYSDQEYGVHIFFKYMLWGLNVLLLLVVICIKYENNVDGWIDNGGTTNSNKCFIFLNRDQTEIA
jgi:hypothetical protein